MTRAAIMLLIAALCSVGWVGAVCAYLVSLSLVVRSARA